MLIWYKHSIFRHLFVSHPILVFVSIIKTSLWFKKSYWRPNTMSLQGHYLCKFPALYIIIINRMVACAHRVALAALRGGQAASAESCTHPAKRDHQFPPPIAERQRLPNVRISCSFVSERSFLFFPVLFRVPWFFHPVFSWVHCFLVVSFVLFSFLY